MGGVLRGDCSACGYTGEVGYGPLMLGDELMPAKCSSCRRLVVVTTRWVEDDHEGAPKPRIARRSSHTCSDCGGPVEPYDLVDGPDATYECPACGQTTLTFADTGTILD